jgi:hypothetical protein
MQEDFAICYAVCLDVKEATFYQIAFTYVIHHSFDQSSFTNPMLAPNSVNPAAMR